MLIRMTYAVSIIEGAQPVILVTPNILYGYYVPEAGSYQLYN
jgi:hypothetical protein